MRSSASVRRAAADDGAGSAAPRAAFDRSRLTEIGHGDLPYWNPVATDALEAMLGRLELATDARVLDVGCGRGRMLIESLRGSGASGVGVDIHVRAISAAREAAARLLPAGAAVFRAEPFDAAAFTPASFDAILCVGALHAAGGLDAALGSFSALLAPRGRMLIGEGCWLHPPAPAYLAHIGAARDEMMSHAANLERMRAHGFEVTEVRATGAAEWEAYETGYRDRVLAWTAAHAAAPGAAAMRAHVLHWHEGFRRWGHDTMGFTLYLLRRG